MAMDPMAMLRAARPNLDPESMRAAQQAIPTPDGVRSVDDLATIPGTPAYRSKMPPPPCFKCGEDHVPNRRYDHPWMQEPHVISADPQVHQMIDRVRQEGAREYGNQPYINGEAREVPAAPTFRVAVYVGRGDDMYVVAAEQAPDWDTVRSFKVESRNVMPMVNLVRALGIKVSDKTGGDLVALSEVGD
jgi:hypothetical protein